MLDVVTLNPHVQPFLKIIDLDHSSSVASVGIPKGIQLQKFARKCYFVLDNALLHVINVEGMVLLFLMLLRMLCIKLWWGLTFSPTLGYDNIKLECSWAYLGTHEHSEHSKECLHWKIMILSF